MSDSESVAAGSAPHPQLGGKSIESLERPRYKSWRKKYRKIRHKFDTQLEENRRLFRDERKLEGIAKRLREELDGLLELCLDLNQNPNIRPELRFDISLPQIHQRRPSAVPEDITPEDANAMLANYTKAVQDGHLPPQDLEVIREQIEERLAAQDLRHLSALESGVSHPIVTSMDEVPEDLKGPEPLGYMMADQEAGYLLRLDAKLGDDSSRRKLADREAMTAEEKQWGDLTTREQDRQTELQNPLSQHNWLKQHFKLHGPTGELIDDNESLASHDKPERVPDVKPASKKRGSKNLAKQVGDRAVERAREGVSPGNGSAFDDEDIIIEEIVSTSGRKKKDLDGSYRGKTGRGGAKGKRKRSGEDGGTRSPADGGSSKKAKTESRAD